MAGAPGRPGPQGRAEQDHQVCDGPAGQDQEGVRQLFRGRQVLGRVQDRAEGVHSLAHQVRGRLHRGSLQAHQSR